MGVTLINFYHCFKKLYFTVLIVTSTFIYLFVKKKQIKILKFNQYKYLLYLFIVIFYNSNIYLFVYLLLYFTVFIVTSIFNQFKYF